MKLLLDTELLLHAAGAPDKLSPAACTLIEDPTNDPLFSAASILEIVLRRAGGSNGYSVDPHLLRRGLLDNGYAELGITGAHALAVASLPPIHTDLFHRILIAQAISHGALLLTRNPQVAQYPGPIRAV